MRRLREDGAEAVFERRRQAGNICAVGCGSAMMTRRCLRCYSRGGLTVVRVVR